MTSPLISVIIPIYNTESYLSECLDSVVNQTLKEIEIICVNDGSTDNSYSILQKYAKMDDRIIIVTQENKGAGAARNAGLAVARGEYLSILDSDDYFDLMMLEKMYERAVNLEADITMCFSTGFDDKSQKKFDFIWSVDVPKDLFSYKDILSILPSFDFAYGWAWDKLFKKSFIDKHKLSFQEISRSNDGYFVFIALYAAERMTLLQESLVYHRAGRAGSIESTHDHDPCCFYEMHKAVRDGLKRLEIFDDMWILFFCWSLKHALWILSIMKTAKGFLEVYTLLQNKIIRESQFSSVSQDSVYLADYYEAQRILTMSPVEYLLEKKKELQKAHDRLLVEQNEERDRLLAVQCDLDAVVASRSYRWGRRLTWLPRKLRGLFRFKRKMVKP